MGAVLVFAEADRLGWLGPPSGLQAGVPAGHPTGQHERGAHDKRQWIDHLILISLYGDQPCGGVIIRCKERFSRHAFHA